MQHKCVMKSPSTPHIHYTTTKLRSKMNEKQKLKENQQQKQQQHQQCGRCRWAGDGVLVCWNECVAIFCWNSECGKETQYVLHTHIRREFFLNDRWAFKRLETSRERERERESEIKSASYLLSLAKNHIYSSYTSYFNTFGSVVCALLFKKKKVNCIVCSVLLLFIFSLCKNARAHTYKKCNKSNECDALYYHIHIHACGFNHHHPQYTNMARKPDKIQVQKILKLLPNG